MKRFFNRTVRILHYVEDASLIAALMVMLCLAITQILMRNLLDSGIFWVESFLRMLVLWVALLGAMVATREQGHISIDALSRYLPDFQKRLVEVITGLVSGCICLVSAWFCMVFLVMEYEDPSIAFGSVPTWVTELIMPFAFLVMGLRFLAGSMQFWQDDQ